MKRRYLFASVIIAALVVGGRFLFKTPPSRAQDDGVASGPTPDHAISVGPASKPEPERMREAKALVERVFSSPIEFYGRVVDQNGDPVPYASIGYTVADKFNASGSNYTGQADADGTFAIIGIRGAGLSVTVRKEGYYLIHNPADRSLPTSTAAFAYGMGPDSYRRPAPSKDKPAVFVLHKMGKTVPLVSVGTRYHRFSTDGQPLEVDIEMGRAVPSGKGQIRFERWADQQRNERGRFNWRFRIMIPGGGLVARGGQFEFEAPEEGYQESIEIDMPTSLGDEWRRGVDGSYFAKLSDGHYARFDISVDGANNNPAFRLTTFLNPTPGNRNLEFDPAKAIKPK